MCTQFYVVNIVRRMKERKDRGRERGGGVVNKTYFHVA
jgi:hypothetical protein